MFSKHALQKLGESAFLWVLFKGGVVRKEAVFFSYLFSHLSRNVSRFIEYNYYPLSQIGVNISVTPASNVCAGLLGQRFYQLDIFYFFVSSVEHTLVGL